MTKEYSTPINLGRALRKELIALLNGGHAHATFEDAVKGLPAKLRGIVPDTLPYSAWQIVEHIRIAQRDMLDFSDNQAGTYQARKWPDDYWPEQPAPPDAKAWQRSISQIHEDRRAFEGLLKDADHAALVRPFAWGNGQSLLQEALQLADHNAYHIGELVVLRRVLGAWK